MRALVLTLAVLGLSAPVHAQDDALGAEMMEAFFAMMGAGTPGSPQIDVTVGVAPAMADPALLPPGAVVLGGITMSPSAEGFGEPNAVVMVRLDADPEAALAAYTEAALPGGWTVEEAGYNPNTVRLCGPEHQGEATFAARREGGTYFAVVIEEGACFDESVVIEDAEVLTEPADDMDDVIGDGEIIDEPGPRSISLPDLFPEAAFADRMEQPFGYTPDALRGGYLRVEVKEGTSVEAVAGLAAAAFEADGWTRLGAGATSGDATVSTWTRTEADSGAPVLATVVVQPTGEGTVEVLVTATR